MNNRLNVIVIRTLTLMIISGWMISCSSSTGSEERPVERTVNEPGLRAELQENTTYVDDSMVTKALVNADNDNNTYVFDVESLADVGIELKNGEILLISKVALGRITSVEESNGQVTVRTGFAALTDAFKEADIEWNQSFEFTPDIIEKSVMVFKGQEFSPRKDDDDNCAGFQDGCFGWNAEVGDYKLKGRIVGQGQDAEVIIIMSKQAGNESVVFRAESTIQKVGNITNIKIEDGETKQFDFQNDNMRGVVKLTLAAAGGGVGPDLSFGPHTMIRFPFTVGPLPVVLAVKVRTVAKVEVVGNSSAQAEATFTYGGKAGIKYNGTELTPFAADGINNPQIGNGGGDLAAMIGLNVDAQWGFTAPELELQLFGNTLVPYLRPEFFIGAKLTWGPVCQNVNLRYNVSSGLDLRFLGQNISTLVERKVVEEERWDHYAPEGCNEPNKLLPDIRSAFVEFPDNALVLD